MSAGGSDGLEWVAVGARVEVLDGVSQWLPCKVLEIDNSDDATTDVHHASRCPTWDADGRVPGRGAPGHGQVAAGARGDEC